LCPGLLKATVEWYRIYKIPDGKPENKFAFNGEAKNREFALHVIEDVHKFWQALHSKEADAGGICLYVLLFFVFWLLQLNYFYHLLRSATSLESSSFKMDLVDAEKVINDSAALGDPLPIDSSGKMKLKKLFAVD
jgi:Inorganic pyrophosphatase